MLRQKSATVTLIQFEDLGCTHCKTYMEAFPRSTVITSDRVKVDFRGLVVTRASAPALRPRCVASEEVVAGGVLFYENQGTSTFATDKGVKRLVKGVGDPVRRRRRQDVSVEAGRRDAAEAVRRNVPGTPWFYVKVGDAPPKLVKPAAYDGESFSAILDDALGR